jgi:hypothetical protein
MKRQELNPPRIREFVVHDLQTESSTSSPIKSASAKGLDNSAAWA